MPSVPTPLFTLTGHRWNVPVLAALSPVNRLGFGELLGAVGSSRDGLVRALGALTRPRWLRREPGRRGAYLLTPRGRRVAAPCVPLVSAAEDAGLSDLAFRKWTLPVLAALRGWEPGYAELRALLGNVSPRALTLTLKDLQAAGLVERTVLGGFPPRTSYRLLSTAGDLIAPLGKL